MSKEAISENKQIDIKKLRKKGFSVKEIAKILSISVSTSSKYCRNLPIDKSGIKRIEFRRFPSKNKSILQKKEAIIFSSRKIKKLNKRDMFIIISALYWGEGTKKELNLINGDPRLIRTFIYGLLSLGIKKEAIKINIRYYSNQNKENVTKFWLEYLGLKTSNLVGYEKVLKSGFTKLEHGMCRVRVVKASFYHKILLSSIDFISSGSSIG